MAAALLYRDLAAFFERLEATPGRLGMTGILVELLAKVPAAHMTAVVRLLQGAVAPDWEGLEVGLAEKQILKVLATMHPKGDAEAVVQTYQELGDLGLAAERLVAGAGKRQVRLMGGGALTVEGVFATMQRLATTTGAGSQEGKQRLLAQLLAEASPIEARFLVRTVAGRLRLGVADMTFLDALAAWRLGRGVQSVQDMEPEHRAEQAALRAELERAYDCCSDLAVVASTLVARGEKGIRAIDIEPLTPLRPMAAERLKTLPEILERMEGRVAMDYKYDGLRIQAHLSRDGRTARLFSRRLEDVTQQYPDLLEALRKHLKGHACIIEGEAVALDDEGRLRPFQDISRRRGRKADLEGAVADIPVTLFVFDCLWLDGESLIGLPFAERRARLDAVVPQDGAVRRSTVAHATTVEEMEAFFDQAVADGAEGIMCKDPRAHYKAGSRGFAWVKFKTDYTEALVDTLDLVCIGAFHGRGRRAGWYGALLMAAYDPSKQAWQSVCKLGTGFDDATLESLKPRFERHLSSARPASVDSGLEADVWFEPAIVMEVQAAELTLSPTHVAGWGMVKDDAGFAARFPRFTRWRDDKGPKQATTVAELATLYKQRHSRQR